ncbi:ABC transporter ATP-binding protein [Sediminicurvatus halobius]|uniref:ABC transporter ATP-binding protein n=1 Tax=Sediminicurvatus halobius TaxID=2182432 RepID=A0A2U2MW16_9GAMM|nr:ABC transporter ATP-binding protein [Spiribacter halobius]PWG61055.1 ABC transporter ATP-binding protein [Spiribacter halobius]UEX76773.1 ABC transporter ATP-binding protein [Spiribacter halobius]
MALEVRGIEAGYGDSRVLFGVDLDVPPGRTVGLLGRNGMGKTTLVRAIMGLLPARAGSVRFRGRTLDRAPAHRRARAGIGLVPEGRRIFPNLSARENLIAAARPGPWGLARVFELFPRLAERRDAPGNRLSGGEQQMLAIGRALMTNPELLILDEATEGLAPAVRADIRHCLQRLRAAGHSLLVIDGDVEAMLGLCDDLVILETGRVVWHGRAEALAADRTPLVRHLGV